MEMVDRKITLVSQEAQRSLSEIGNAVGFLDCSATVTALSSIVAATFVPKEGSL